MLYFLQRVCCVLQEVYYACYKKCAMFLQDVSCACHKSYNMILKEDVLICFTESMLYFYRECAMLVDMKMTGQILVVLMTLRWIE